MYNINMNATNISQMHQKFFPVTQKLVKKIEHQMDTSWSSVKFNLFFSCSQDVKISIIPSLQYKSICSLLMYF